MTKVDLYFSAPESQHGVELGIAAQAAWDLHEAEPTDENWERVLDRVHEQMHDHILTYTGIEELDEVHGE